MKSLSRLAALSMVMLSSMIVTSGPAFADPANVGQPFGTAVVVPATPVNDDVHDNAPGTLDDAIMGALADDDAGDIRGHGREDAPGHNKP